MTSQLETCIPQAHEPISVTIGKEGPKDIAVDCLIVGCNWSGTSQDILDHCKKNHPQNIWWNGEKEKKFTIHDITKYSYKVEFIVAHSHLFWFHIKNDLEKGNLYAACQHITTVNDDPDCRFMIRTVLKDKTRMSCVSCCNETRPHSEDIEEVLIAQKCTVRPIKKLGCFTNENNDINLDVSISKTYVHY